LSRSPLGPKFFAHQPDREDRPARTRLVPEWLKGWLQQVADLFEPFSGVARAGYECFQANGTWEISLFLGQNELLGGSRDGLLLPVNFRFDVAGLLQQFSELNALKWNAFPDAFVFRDAGYPTESFLLAEGTVRGEVIRLQVQALPPDAIGPGLQFLPNGEHLLVGRSE
jgi:hypothetical protein